jgi:glycyl-tRNA synthetase
MKTKTAAARPLARELSFYSKASTDFDSCSLSAGEMWGVADRTDYDLTQHQNTSGKTLEYIDSGKTTLLP